MKKQLFLFVLSLTLLTPTLCKAELKVVMIDVGMGQSILLADNNHGILIDTGLGSYSEHILHRINFHGIETLDYLILSHLHSDHAGGYLKIRDTWPQTPVFTDCNYFPTLHSSEKSFFWRTHEILSNDPLHKCLKANDNFNWQGHTISVLWPDITNLQTGLNAHSLVLLISTRQGRTVLIMGDVSITVERAISETVSQLLDNFYLDIYVVNHHGAIDTTTPDFLQILRPAISLISVGKENPYGYPAKKTLNMLRLFSKQVLRTDQDGEICFTTKENFFIRCLPPVQK